MKSISTLMKNLLIGLSLYLFMAIINISCSDDVANVENNSTNNTSGSVTTTVTLPEGETITADSYCSVTLDDDDSYSTGWAGGSNGVNTTDSPSADCNCTPGANSYICTVTDVPTGTYYLASVIFVGQDSGSRPSAGDFKGYYGSNNDTTPEAPNATVIAGQDNPFSLSQVVITE